MPKTQEPKKYSLTKIVATLGPASENEDTLRKMIEAGMNVARINCSHGDWTTRKDRIDLVRRLAKEYNRSIGILVDLQGPKIRTGTLPDDGIKILAGEKITLTTIEANANYTQRPFKVFIRNYPNLSSEVKPEQRVLFDDGLLRLEVNEIKGAEVYGTVTVGGILKSNKGVNLPESEQLGLEAITPKDKEDIIEAVKYEADFIALSFVRQAQDIQELKALIQAANPQSPIKTIAKIEKPQAMTHLDAILEEVDGVMVARGDLGVELEPEKVPILQKEIIRRAGKHDKFVITATQMMDSMIKNPFPTRAEVSDVANAILDGTDAVMLSGETASGAHPVAAVDYMRKVALEVEGSTKIYVPRRNLEDLDNFSEDRVNAIAIAHGAEDLAKLRKIRTIVAFSCSGKSAQLISQLRPQSKIVVATTFRHTYNYLSIVWGVTPIFFDNVQKTTQTLINIEDELKEYGLVEEGETIVITGGLPIAARTSANFVKLHKCDGSMAKLVEEYYIKAQEPRTNLGPTLKGTVNAS